MELKLASVISSLVKDGVFGETKFVDLVPDNTKMGAQFLSDLAFVNLTVEGISGKKIYPLVVKLPFKDPLTREANNCKTMFHNEVAMYKEILPGLGMDEQAYPKMYYGIANNGVDPESDLLILENLKYKHFELSKTKVFLDIDHISTAIRTIAEFHSGSYRLKHENKEKFLAYTKTLKDVVLPKTCEHEYSLFNIAAMERGIKPLLQNNIRVDALKNCSRILKYPFHKVLKLLSQPEEPYAVICHGDFCNNNVLYKFDESGKPIDCIFYDLQMSQYASPAIDLFFFLYMHTTSDIREQHWDELIKLYWDSLRKSVPNHIDIPSFKDFLKHFTKRAIYGYVICALFLPAMIVDKPIKMEEIKSLSLEEKTDLLVAQGGDEGERVISEIFLHLLNKGYIDSFLELCKERNFEC